MPRAQLGEAGRAHVLAHDTMARIAQETVAVYEQVVEDGGGPGQIASDSARSSRS